MLNNETVHSSLATQNINTTKAKRSKPMQKWIGWAAISFALLQVGCATPVGEIESWPITAAEKSQFSGKVVNIQCELGGNCAEQCGQGTQQLAVKSNKTGTVLIAKNLSNYSGAADELWRFCDQQVELNGLFTEHRGVRFFQIQNVRAKGGEWQRANQFLSDWAERGGKTPLQAQNWHEHDDRVKAIIERDGRLGLGPQADQEYFK
jgi:hypothetical protein